MIPPRSHYPFPALAEPCLGTQVTEVQLKPGELLIAHKPSLVTTVLGSCVAVTMFNARFSLGAICHAMLPQPGREETLSETDPTRFKYVNYAVSFMVSAFRQAGLCADEVDVKLFGGGNVIGPEIDLLERPGIGSANVRMVRQLLQQESFRISASNVGGRRGRKIVFSTHTGKVLHKHLSCMRFP